MSLFVPPRAQYADANGSPLAGAKLYFYLTGTSTPQDTYTDSGLTTTNANPVIADASGIFGSIYLASSNDYKVILKTSADVTVWTVDPYLSSGDTGRVAVADTNYTASLNDRVIAYTSLTANRVVTLPAALTFPSGARLTIADESGNATASTKMIQVAPAGSDTLDGATGTREGVVTAYGCKEYRSNGSDGWFLVDRDMPERGHIAGLTLSTAGSSATFSVAAGQCADKNNTVMMILAAAMSKTTSAWAAGTGNGSLDTGSIANSTGYHVWLIKTAAGVVDVLTSTSATAPTLPTGYTLSRRIGWMKTDGSAQWTKFVQDGDLFEWDTPVADISAANPGTSAVTRTLSVPSGVNVQARVQAGVISASGAGITYALFTDLATADVVPIQAKSDLPATWTGGNGVSSSTALKDIRTNTSAQIRSRISFSDASVSVNINTLGWLDARGRND
jgi:hypothetical protein